MNEENNNPYNVSTFMSKPNDNTSALQLRLDTQQLLTDIELFLKGQRSLIQKDDVGRLVEVNTKIGEPLVNEKGVQGLMAFISMVINPHTVQGNYKEEKYTNECANIREELAQIIVDNRNHWDLSSYHMNLVCNSMMNLIKPFLSRLIGNKERESYGQSMKVEERSNPGEGRGFFPFGGFGGRK